MRNPFWPEDAEIILGLPIAEGEQDWLACHYDAAGKFSVKSAYKLAVQIRDNQQGNDVSGSNTSMLSTSGFEWHKIWQLRLPNKVKMFLWRFAHNSLPCVAISSVEESKRRHFAQSAVSRMRILDMYFLGASSHVNAGEC